MSLLFHSLAESFLVGRKMVMSMYIKPQSLTGLIFAVFPHKSRGDYMALELKNGSVSKVF